MNSKQILFLTTMVYLLFLMGISAIAQDEITLNYRLVYTIPHESALDARQLMAIDLEGNAAKFTENILYKDQIYMSPDQWKISGRNPTGDLVILDNLGNTIINEPTTTFENGWYVWGWRNNEVILSQIKEGYLEFYSFDLTTESISDKNVEHLNAFFVWNISELNGRYWQYMCYCDLFKFSPSFRYAVSPSLVYGGTVEAQDTTMIFWDTVAKTAQGIDGATAWWYDLNGFPVWAHSEELMVLSMYDENGNSNLFSYDYSSSPKLINYSSCLSDLCEPQSFSWSPNDGYLAFWRVNIDQSLEQHNDLIVINMRQNREEILLSGGYTPSPIFWSPDDRYIAFTNLITNNGSEILWEMNIFDINTKRIALSQSIEELTGLVGWLNV